MPKSIIPNGLPRLARNVPTAIATLYGHPNNMNGCRISDILQPFILFGWQYNVAIAVGTFLANLGSPFGIIDFGMMPFVSLIAGFCGYLTSKYFSKIKVNQYIGMFVFAHFIAMGVGLVLYVGAGVPYVLGYVSVLVSGLISNFIGVPIVNKLVSTLKKRGFDI